MESIFETLEALPVLEECYEDISNLVEAKLLIKL